MSRSALLIDNLSISGFQKLFESIQDVAQNDFLFVPENTESVCISDKVMNAYCSMIETPFSWTAALFETSCARLAGFLDTRSYLPRALFLRS